MSLTRALPWATRCCSQPHSMALLWLDSQLEPEIQRRLWNSLSPKCVLPFLLSFLDGDILSSPGWDPILTKREHFEVLATPFVGFYSPHLTYSRICLMLHSPFPELQVCSYLSLGEFGLHLLEEFREGCDQGKRGVRETWDFGWALKNDEIYFIPLPRFFKSKQNYIHVESRVKETIWCNHSPCYGNI